MSEGAADCALWRDFNDAGPVEEPEGSAAGALQPDPESIAAFLDTVFGYSDGLIPVRSFPDGGTGGKPHTIWIDADDSAPEKLATFASWAAREGMAVYVIPGTVAENGEARAADIRQMQTVLVDLDHGDIAAKREHLEGHLGEPAMVVESGGVTAEGAAKLHLWWRLTEPAEREDIPEVCRLRGEIAMKVGGDPAFRSAHQPIRVAGTLHLKSGAPQMVRIVHRSAREVDLADFTEAVAAMPAMPGAAPVTPDFSADAKPFLNDVLTTPVREGAQDGWTRFEGASAAIGHYIRMVHEGRLDEHEGWEAIRGYNAAMLRPSWPEERLLDEAERLWKLHVERNGPPRPAMRNDSTIASHTLGSLLDDRSPMPADIIAPRVLTPGGMLVLGGAPKVGKSDFLISLLVHMAAGEPFLGFAPPRPLRVFYLQAEIQYHYLRERVQGIALDPETLAAARETFVATPKLDLLLDETGVARATEAVRAAFPDAPPDILCIDPIRNLFDGGPSGAGENDNAAMMAFLQTRVCALRDAIDPDCGIVLVHHTRKLAKHQVKEDPFLALSGASALRGFYTAGMIMHRPDEDTPERRLEIELRNGPALPAKLIDKERGRWVEINPMNERLVRREVGAKHDAERDRKRDVILSILLQEAAEGRLYTSTQFREAFENEAGLGSQYTIRDRMGVLATKGGIKFVRDAAAFGLPPVRTRFGYLCVEGMRFGREAQIDPETGEVFGDGIPVLPSHYKCPRTGACLEVENPSVWVYPEGEDD